MRGQFRSMFNRMRDLYLNRLTASRAEKIDYLDALVSSRQAGDVAQQQYEEMLRQILMAGGFRCEVFKDPGTYNFRVPVGVTCLLVSLCGSGAGVASNYSYVVNGGGAPSLLRVPLAVVPGAMLPITIPPPGANKVQSIQGTVTGNDGAATTVGSLSAPGGLAGSCTYASGAPTRVGGLGRSLASGNTTDARISGNTYIASDSKFLGSPFFSDGTPSNGFSGISALDWINGAGSTGKPGAALLEWWGASA